MSLEEEFQQAVIDSKNLPAQSNDHLLKIYALYKQATIGNVNIEKPTNFFDIAGVAKYNAWEALQGTSLESAKQQYIDFVNSLKS
jgi:diazepam-binding inhibitor (GABA receptor modulating acyl-CoA-binding protein)